MQSSRKRTLQTLVTPTRFFSPVSTHVQARTLLTSTDPLLTSEEKEACDLIKEGNALAKIIPTQYPSREWVDAAGSTLKSPWYTFLDGLQDYNQQLHLRADSKDGFSYDPMTDTIKETSYSKPSTHTQAISTTLISPLLHTPLFGAGLLEQDTAATLGLVFKLQECRLRALFSDTNAIMTNHGIFSFSDIHHLYQFREKIKPYTFDNLPQFKALINAEDWTVCNEVMAEVRREALKAIIIDTTYEKSSSLPRLVSQKALKRRDDVERKLHVDLPIICYNAETTDGLKVFSKAEQHLEELRAQLESKLDDRYQSPHLPSLRLFAPEDLTYSVSVRGFVAGDLDIKTAQSILNLIRTYHTQKLSAQDAKEIIKSKVETKDPHHRFVV